MPLQFDIRAILKSSAPKAKVPIFLIRYLERITHVEQMNAFLRVHTTERDYDFIRPVLDEELCCTASIDGTENIPTDGRPVIFVSNHPLGGLDGMIIAQMIHESRAEKRELKVIVNDLLMYMEPLAGLWAPVSKLGRFSKEQAAEQQRMWESETDVLTFPAGACSR
ncbi:MAG: 1-acyl-sn-glycerol-3-phosphate acyltransferase, partial [Paludibacteraceae bacterium]|nr:1-acyl-sn-glycerol-3-phosphate acyltransferase [Paludibacteraceae bacterium]